MTPEQLVSVVALLGELQAEKTRLAARVGELEQQLSAALADQEVPAAAAAPHP